MSNYQAQEFSTTLPFSLHGYPSRESVRGLSGQVSLFSRVQFELRLCDHVFPSQLGISLKKYPLQYKIRLNGTRF